MIRDIVLVRCSRTIDKMWTVACLLVIFVLLNFSKAFKSVKDMKWKKDPAISAWGECINKNYVPFDQRSVLLILNEANYTKNTEKTFIATGVLLDNSRILTSYNPFKEFINKPKYTDNIVVVLVTGTFNFTVRSVVIQDDIVCGRQIAYLAGKESNYLNTPSPIHDLMVLRMAEEIGIASRSYNFVMNWAASIRKSGSYVWTGQIVDRNSLISLLAVPGEQIHGPLWICSLVFTVEKEQKVYETIATYIYDEEDSVLVDCEEWLPRNWGFFICIRNIYNLSGLASGSTLFMKRKLLGIGSFAMFKNNTGILVFTDVRPYVDIIMQTCGDEEFT